MNNNSNDKTINNNSILKTIFLSGKIVNPRREWYILVGLFIIFILASIGFDFYMYQQTTSEDMFVSVSRADLSIENLKTSDLQKIISNFQAKEEAITMLKIGNLVDPSL